MQITIVGSGNVAYHLYQACQQFGISIANVVVRTAGKLSWIPSNLESINTDLSKSKPDLIFLAVADQAIEKILVQFKFPTNSIIVHTSGSISLDVFRGTAISNYGVIYPLQTLSMGVEVDYRTLPLYIEGNSDDSLKVINQFANQVSRKIHQAKSQQRLALHLAAVISNNFTNALMQMSKDILDQNDLDFQQLKPLMEETIKKAFATDPTGAQTGPALRNDEITMKKHIEILENPLLQDIYKLLSQHITRQKGKIG
jgi:predicted short-subunit dehydrogenase-like oxidoreductase (DUF2520 family)